MLFLFFAVVSISIFSIVSVNGGVEGHKVPAQFMTLIVHLEHFTNSQTQLKDIDNDSLLTTDFEERLVENPEQPHCHSRLVNCHGKVNTGVYLIISHCINLPFEDRYHP